MPEVIGPDSMGDVHFDDYDMVVLMDVASFAPVANPKGGMDYPQMDQLEAYVRSGGGLVVFLGDKIDTNFYNSRFYNSGNGLSPFTLTRRVEAGSSGAYERVPFFQFDPKSIAGDQIVQTFYGDYADACKLMRFFQFFRADESSIPASSPDAKPPRVLARFSDDQKSAAIAVRQLGRGTSVVFYTSAHRRSGNSEWSDWPNDDVGTFPSVMYDTLLSISRQQPLLTEMVGKPIVYRLPGDLQDVVATLRTPRYPAHDLESLKAESIDKADKSEKADKQLVYEKTAEAGTYTLTLKPAGGAEQQVLFTRYVDPLEGNLQPAWQSSDRDRKVPQVLAAAFGSENFSYAKPREGVSEDTGPAREYWQWVIGALLALIALEVFLAQRFGHYTSFNPGLPGGPEVR